MCHERIIWQVPVPQPYTVEKKVPYPVKVPIHVPVPYEVEKKIPYEVKVSGIRNLEER